MKVSVIIPVFNGSLLIKRCLDSVFNQGEVYDLEVIVVDDGSTDNSSDIVRNYTEQVKLLQQDNLGPAAARNRGIEIATGKYIAFLDSDDYWGRGFLEATVSFLENNPNAVATSVGQLHKIPGKPDTVTPSALINPEIFSEPILLDDFFKFWATYNHVCTGSVLMRLDAVRQTGGQRSEFRITEDLEFWAYLATFGKWGFIPKVLFVSDGGAVTKKTGWIEKNRNRWTSAPTVEEWEARIIKRIKHPLPAEYLAARGKIAGNLAYSMILSSRNRLARQTIQRYRMDLPKGRQFKALKAASTNMVVFNILCIIIRKREKHRKIQ